MAFHALKLVWPYRYFDAPLLRESNQNVISITPMRLHLGVQHRSFLVAPR
jgi:hypothetical protein